MKVYKSWFTQKREQFGKDWFNKIKINDLVNNSERILTDIIKGNFDNERQDFTDLCNPNIIEVLFAFVEKRRNHLIVMNESVRFYQKTYNDSVIQETVEMVSNMYKCYQTCYNYLAEYRITMNPATLEGLMLSLREFGNFVSPSKVI